MFPIRNGHNWLKLVPCHLLHLWLRVLNVRRDSSSNSRDLCFLPETSTKTHTLRPLKEHGFIKRKDRMLTIYVAIVIAISILKLIMYFVLIKAHDIDNIY